MTPFPRETYQALDRYAPDRRPVEVDLSDNTNRWGAHPAALEVVRSASPADLVGYPSVYADGLRAAVARRFGVPEEAVATGCGSDDLLDSTFRAAGEPGEAIRFLPPTFSMVDVFARVNGLAAEPVSREGHRPERPFGDLPDPAELLEDRPALVYLCRPNNPTGEVLPLAWIEELLEAAAPEGPLVLVDEAYAEFVDGEGAGELARRAAGSRRLVVVRTLSKAYGLAGLRIGYAVGPPDVIGEIEKSRGPYKVGRLAERAAVAAVEDREGWVPEVTARVREARARLVKALEDRGLAPLPSGANFLLLPLPREGIGGPPGAAEVTATLRELGVAVRPFPALPGIGEAIRVSVGPREETDRFLDALDRVLGAGTGGPET